MLTTVVCAQAHIHLLFQYNLPRDGIAYRHSVPFLHQVATEKFPVRCSKAANLIEAIPLPECVK